MQLQGFPAPIRTLRNMFCEFSVAVMLDFYPGSFHLTDLLSSNLCKNSYINHVKQLQQNMSLCGHI